MTFHQHPNFMSTYRGVNASLAQCLNSVLNVKVQVGPSAFSVIVKTDGSFEALVRSLHESVV